MHSVYFDARTGDDERRTRIFQGHLFLYSATPASIALVEHARELFREAFGDLDPRTAQFSLPVEDFVEIVAPLKPRFIHHPRTKQLLREILSEVDCDLEKTYFDVPRLRVVSSDAYLTSGVGYQLHPHRDTWFSQPLSQLNWWIPVYDITSESSMAFHMRYFDRPIKNSSNEFNYYEWNATGRKDAAKHVKRDTRKQPEAQEELELDPQVRLVFPAGGILIFSAAHLHSTVPNTSGVTRFSIDFRTAHFDDLDTMGGAPNIDSHSTGTSLRDLMRGSDLEPLPDELVARYDDPETLDRGQLVFQPTVDRS
jgi:Phytanoyl-CoA dioxygenase (PhyH)